MQIIISGVSGSGKTSIVKQLIKDNCGVRPIQFTTRKPRNDLELDEYVFITRAQFITKMENGDFVGYTTYNGEYYGITKYFDRSKVNVFVVEPEGRVQLIKHFKLNSIRYVGFYLELDKEEAIKRMQDRGDIISKIESRLEDFKYFYPEKEDIVLDGRLPIDKNLSIIKKWVS